MYQWMMESWIHDIEDKIRMEKNIAILIGSFYNHEAAKQMHDMDNPKYASDDEDFEESFKYVQSFKKPEETETFKQKLKRERQERKKGKRKVVN